MPIDYAEFEKVDMHSGIILDAQIAQNTHKPAYQLRIDFGETIGIKRSSAQLTRLYTAEELIGKTIIAVTNLTPRQIGTFVSEVLVLGIPDEGDGIILLSSDKKAIPGKKVF